MAEPVNQAYVELAALADHPWENRWGGHDERVRPVPLASDHDHATLRASAVLVIGTPTADDDVAFLLVERSPHTRHHPGQFAFPGGGIDPGEDPTGAAIRECYEESGVRVNREQVLGVLPSLVLHASGNVVTPVLAWLDEPQAAELPPVWSDPEIAARYWVPRRTLTDPAHRATIVVQDRWAGPGFLVADKWVWGFTAIVLDELLTALEWNRPWDQSVTFPLEVAPLPES